MLEFGGDVRKETAKGVIENVYDFVRRTEYAEDSAKDFCGTNTPITQLRKLRDDADENGYDLEVWKKMVELGWSAIPWSEEHGGLEFGYKGLGVVTEESGRTLTASPLFSTVWVGGTIINLGASEDQKAELLRVLPQVRLFWHWL